MGRVAFGQVTSGDFEMASNPEMGDVVIGG